MSADNSNLDKLPRAESRLKNLPEARQDAIYEHLTLASVPETVKQTETEGAKGSASSHTTRLRRPTLVETVAWLGQDGVQTCVRALSEWRRWYVERRRRQAEAASAADMLADCKQEGWFKTAEEERAASQILFSRLAIHDANWKAWAANEKLAVAKDKIKVEKERVQQSKEELDLQREKFQFDAATACLKHLPRLRSIAANSALDESAKINAVREALFGEIPK
jgi:hypothetical protein